MFSIEFASMLLPQRRGQHSGESVHKLFLHFNPINRIKSFQFGVEVETNSRIEESTASFGYQVDLPKADLVFKGNPFAIHLIISFSSNMYLLIGCVDSNWTVAGVLEKRLTPLPFTFALSGMLNHVKGQSRFGIGLTIG